MCCQKRRPHRELQQENEYKVRRLKAYAVAYQKQEPGNTQSKRERCVINATYNQHFHVNACFLNDKTSMTKVPANGCEQPCSKCKRRKIYTDECRYRMPKKPRKIVVSRCPGAPLRPRAKKTINKQGAKHEENKGKEENKRKEEREKSKAIRTILQKIAENTKKTRGRKRIRGKEEKAVFVGWWLQKGRMVRLRESVAEKKARTDEDEEELVESEKKKGEEKNREKEDESAEEEGKDGGQEEEKRRHRKSKKRKMKHQKGGAREEENLKSSGQQTWVRRRKRMQRQNRWWKIIWNGWKQLQRPRQKNLVWSLSLTDLEIWVHSNAMTMMHWRWRRIFGIVCVSFFKLIFQRISSQPHRWMMHWLISFILMMMTLMRMKLRSRGWRKQFSIFLLVPIHFWVVGSCGHGFEWGSRKQPTNQTTNNFWICMVGLARILQVYGIYSKHG